MALTTKFHNPLEGLKNIGKALQYTSGVAPAIAVGKKVFGGESKPTTPTAAPDFASQLGEFSQYLPEGYDIEAAMKWNERLKSDENFKKTVEALGITPNFIKQQQQQPQGLELQSLLTGFLQPQLQRQSQQQMSIADQYSQTMNQLLGSSANLGPYADILKRQVPMEVAQMKQQAQATEQTGGIGMLLKLMQAQAAQRQEQAYQRGLASAGATGGGGFAESL